MKQISRLTPCSLIKIWQPRWKDRVVLIAVYKVKAHNEIVFTKAKNLTGTSYYLSGETIKKYPVETNGTIPCYAVGMSELDELERI
jgi:hypothetical protein